jgi:hypothetical protein
MVLNHLAKRLGLAAVLSENGDYLSKPEVWLSPFYGVFVVLVAEAYIFFGLDPGLLRLMYVPNDVVDEVGLGLSFLL